MDALKIKYAVPSYGTDRMPSKNFRDFQWIRNGTDGMVIDPYKLLNTKFSDPDLARVDEYEDLEVIDEGGAAVIAYCVLESGLLTEDERQNLRSQLLRYCELDTFAMVMAWEALEILATS